MAVEDHPKYAEWLATLDHLTEATQRYRDATRRKDKALETYRIDFVKAQQAYNKLSEEIG